MCEIVGGYFLMKEQNIDGNDVSSEKIPLGMKELKYEVKYIENPLPVPKRREHKAMDYAIDLNSENDHYDINDMTGMDFFDIE